MNPLPVEVSSFFEFFTDLRITRGTLQFKWAFSDGSSAEGAVFLSADIAGVTINHSELGSIRVTDATARSTLGTDEPSEQTIASPVVAEDYPNVANVSPDVGYVASILQTLAKPNQALADYLKKLFKHKIATATLIIPGAAAFNVHSKAFKHGPLELPRMKGDFEIRSLIIDLLGGNFAFDLLIRAKADDFVKYVENARSFSLLDAEIYLSSEASYNIWRNNATVVFKALDIRGSRTSGQVPVDRPKGTVPMLFETTGADFSIRDGRAAVDLGTNTTTAEAGDITLSFPAGKVSVASLGFSNDTYLFSKFSASLEDAVLHLQVRHNADGTAGFAGSLKCEHAMFAFDSLTVAPTVDRTIAVGGKVADNDTYEARGLIVNLPSGHVSQGFLGVRRLLGAAHVAVSGVTVDVAANSANKIRITAEFPGLESRLGLQLRLPSCRLQLGKQSLDVKDLVVDHWEERFIQQAPPEMNSLQTHSISQVSLAVGSFDIQKLDRTTSRVPLDAGGVIRAAVQVLRDNRVNVGSLGETIAQALEYISDPLIFLAGKLGDILPLAPVIKERTLVFELGDGAVSFDAAFSDSSTIAFRVRRSIEKVRLYLKVSVLDPKWDDLFHRSDKDVWPLDLTISPPLTLELVVRIAISVSTTGRELNVDGLDIIIPINGVPPEALVQVEDFLFGWMGYGQLIDKLVAQLRLRVPLQFPQSWSINVVISKDDSMIRLSATAVERTFSDL